MIYVPSHVRALSVVHISQGISVPLAGRQTSLHLPRPLSHAASGIYKVCANSALFCFIIICFSIKYLLKLLKLSEEFPRASDLNFILPLFPC